MMEKMFSGRMAKTPFLGRIMEMVLPGSMTGKHLKAGFVGRPPEQAEGDHSPRP